MGALTLQPDGLLPSGIHPLTPEELRELFVENTGDRATRDRIYRRWHRHRASLASMVTVTHQWIDGSYVTDKAKPGDIDVVNFVTAESYDGLAPSLRDIVDSLTAGPDTRNQWGVDSYVVFTYPDGHPLETANGTQIDYWHTFWSSVRGRDDIDKGFVEVTL